MEFNWWFGWEPHKDLGFDDSEFKRTQRQETSKKALEQLEPYLRVDKLSDMEEEKLQLTDSTSRDFTSRKHLIKNHDMVCQSMEKIFEKFELYSDETLPGEITELSKV